MPTLKQLLAEKYKSNSEAEKNFIDKHVAEVIPDAAGNGDDVFKGKIVKKDKSRPADYKDGEDEAVYEDENLEERSLSSSEEKKKEEIVISMKKNKKDLMKRYGDDWKSVVYGTATKIAKESVNESVKISDARYVRAHGNKPTGKSAFWLFTNKEKGDANYDDPTQVFKVSGGKVLSYRDAEKEAKNWARVNGHSTIYVMESVNESKKMKNDPCWDDHEMIGHKTKNGKKVPNCVPKNENLEESFTPAQIKKLKDEYSDIKKMDPSSETYKKLTSFLNKLSDKQLVSLYKADINFVSKLAYNRMIRKGLVEGLEESVSNHLVRSREYNMYPLKGKYYLGIMSDGYDSFHSVFRKEKDIPDSDTMTKAYREMEVLQLSRTTSVNDAKKAALKAISKMNEEINNLIVNRLDTFIKERNDG